MPTVFMAYGFRFEIYPGDHDPPHVHVKRGRSHAKVALDPVRFEKSRNLTASEALKVKRWIVENRDLLLIEWRRLNG